MMEWIARTSNWVLGMIGSVLSLVITVALVYWWHTYWAQYVAQNVLPPSLWTLVGIAIAQFRTHRKLDRHHEEMKQHVTDQVAQPPQT